MGISDLVNGVFGASDEDAREARNGARAARANRQSIEETTRGVQGLIGLGSTVMSAGRIFNTGNNQYRTGENISEMDANNTERGAIYSRRQLEAMRNKQQDEPQQQYQHQPHGPNSSFRMSGAPQQAPAPVNGDKADPELDQLITQIADATRKGQDISAITSQLAGGDGKIHINGVADGQLVTFDTGKGQRDRNGQLFADGRTAKIQVRAGMDADEFVELVQQQLRNQGIGARQQAPMAAPAAQPAPTTEPAAQPHSAAPATAAPRVAANASLFNIPFGQDGVASFDPSKGGNLEVATSQAGLEFLGKKTDKGGVDDHKVDGKKGGITDHSIIEFKREHGLAANAEIDDAFKQALAQAVNAKLASIKGGEHVAEATAPAGGGSVQRQTETARS